MLKKSASVSVAALYETLDDVLSDIHHKNVYLARIDGEIVGSVALRLLTDGIAYLSRFSIDPEAQNLASAACSWKRCVSNVFPWECARSRCIPHPRCVPQWLLFEKRLLYPFHFKDSDYIRALMVNEICEMDEMFDYETVCAKAKH